MRDPFVGILPFVHVAETRSFKAAAERLGVTSAAVSKAVAKLEEELGVRLFDRTTRRVEPTEEGELFLGHCREALGLVVGGRERLAQAQAVAAGDLTVALPFIMGRRLIAVLPTFTARYPELRLHLRLSDRFSRLVDEHIDVAIRLGQLADSSVIARKLADTRWVTVASPAYLARHGTPRKPEELHGHDCLLFHAPRGSNVEWSFRARPRSSERISLALEPRLDLDQGELLVDAALAGLGIAQVLAYMAEPALREGRLVEVLADHGCAALPIHALCKPGQQNVVKVRALLDFLVEAF
ncbi:MAG: LysR family transcriptional regulator [Myxococcales bacterium]|nr:LysR family transcriptional regulator [Myxococcales bacterium]